jgi:hypothetical protein
MFLHPQALNVALVAGQHRKDREWMQVTSNFEAALRKSRQGQIWDAILFRSNKLRTFDEAMQNHKLIERFDLGMSIVPVEKIIGSVGRQQDFDQKFMPRHEHLSPRWRSVDHAYYMGTMLPIIEVLKLDDEYYVVDGHHRVSVARYHGQEYMEAHVIEVHAEVWKTSTEIQIEPACVAYA